MTEAEARQVVLLRAFEDPLAAPWTAADRDAASRDAARALGEKASTERFVAHRAAAAVGELARRLPAVTPTLAALTAPVWLVPAVLLLGFGAGLAIDAVGNARRINLLPPHLLAMLAWNVAVYVLVAAHAWSSGDGAWLPLGWLRRFGRRVASVAGTPPPTLTRFVADWVHASQGLQGARLAATLHTAAACFAVGAIVSMYARGSFFELRAGWESTFFEAPTMHHMVTLLLGPASRLSGIAMPDEAGFAALNFAQGGEIAARWIHLFAVTIVAVIVLPRLVLAAWAAWQARALRLDFALPLGEPYFRQLRPAAGGAAAATVQVLPYSYQLAPERAAKLGAVLGGAVRLHEAVPLGGEDEPARWLPAPDRDDAAPWAALFSATATPERETHGAFVQALAARRPAGAALQVWIDEADMRLRFDGDAGERRIEQRRDAWRRMLAPLGHEPRFVDLAAR